MPRSAGSSLGSAHTATAPKTPTSLSLVGRQPSPILRASASSTASSAATAGRIGLHSDARTARSPHPYGSDSAVVPHASPRDASNTSRESHQSSSRHVQAAAAAPLPPPSTVAVSESPSSAPARELDRADKSLGHVSAGADSLAAITAVTRNEGSLFRQVYNEKLRSSVQSIIHSLTVELPADHVFIQLLADPTTMAYCKVRLAEVVEAFLYATQAQQFHNLVAELAQQHEALLLAQQELDRVRRQGVAAPEPNRVAGGRGEPFTDDRDARSSRSSQRPANAADFHTPLRHEMGVDPVVTPSTASENPMSDDAARQVLLSLLEEATRDHELERSRQSLAGPDRLVKVATESWQRTSSAPSGGTSGSRERTDTLSTDALDEKVEYLASVMAELYDSVSGLLHYVDGSLEGLDALRNDLERHQASTAPTGDGARDHGLMNTPMSLVERSDIAAAAASGTTSTMTKFAPRGPSARRSAVADERQHVRALLDKLRDAQVHSARTLDRLGQDVEQLARRDATNARALEVAQRELKVATTAAEGAKQLEASVERLRAEYQRTHAAEREDAHAQIDALQAKLSQALSDVRVLESAARARDNLAEELSVVRQERDDAIDRVTLAEQELATRRQSADALQQIVHQTEKENTVLRRDLGNCEGELLCAQVELHITQLECGYLQSEVQKHELMTRDGYTGLARAYRYLVEAQTEAARHAQVQRQMTETAALQKDVARQQAQSELSDLLRTMWADEDGEAAVTRPFAGRPASQHPEPRVDAAVSENKSARTLGTRHRSADPDGAQPVQERHRMPGTLPGLTTALALTYASLHRQHAARLARVTDLEDALVREEARLQSLNATNADLQAAVAAERAQAAALRKEMDLLSTNNPMKALLARQEALLASVTDERVTMRDRWSALNADYVALERRNAELHARCVGKEHENAKLTGLIKSLNSSPAKLNAIHSPQVESAYRPREDSTVAAGYASARTHTPASAASRTTSSVTAAATPANVTTVPAGTVTPPSLPRPRTITATTSARPASSPSENTVRTERPTPATPASTTTARSTTSATGARLIGSPNTSASSTGVGQPLRPAAGTPRVDNVARALLTPEKN